MTIKGANEGASLRSSYITTYGSYCLGFFYLESDINVGSLSVSLWNNRTNMATNVWKKAEELPGLGWSKVLVSLNITEAVQVSLSSMSISLSHEMFFFCFDSAFSKSTFLKKYF